jgi:hypothetical protein
MAKRDEMTSEASDPLPVFEVGVAIVPGAGDPPASARLEDRRNQGAPGYDEALGRKSSGRHAGNRLVLTGGEVVRAATEAVAGQIGLAAQRIAGVLEAQAEAVPRPGALCLDSVEVSFGITLTSGVQAMFTAQAESSLQVTIVMSRQQADGG